MEYGFRIYEVCNRIGKCRGCLGKGKSCNGTGKNGKHAIVNASTGMSEYIKK